jgi:hypothetical protein
VSYKYVVGLRWLSDEAAGTSFEDLGMEAWCFHRLDVKTVPQHDGYTCGLRIIDAIERTLGLSVRHD